jgi:hypothetical protein
MTSLTDSREGTILAVSGSLRRSSINSAVLRAAAAAARDCAVVVIDDSVRGLPHFDPDLETKPPEPVLRFRAACEGAVGVLLAVPEYTWATRLVQERAGLGCRKWLPVPQADDRSRRRRRAAARMPATHLTSC